MLRLRVLVPFAVLFSSSSCAVSIQEAVQEIKQKRRKADGHHKKAFGHASNDNKATQVRPLPGSPGQKLSSKVSRDVKIESFMQPAVNDCSAASHWSFIVASMPRSGSTLIFNALKLAFPNAAIDKVHDLAPIRNKIEVAHRAAQQPTDIVFFPFRNPFNSITSGVLVYHDRNELKVVSEVVKDFETAGAIWASFTRKTLFDAPSTVPLQYECFDDNLDFAFDQMENATGCVIAESARLKIIKDLDVKKIHDLTVGKQFVYWDSKSRFHGSHVSTNMGHTDYRKELSQKSQELLEKNTMISHINKTFGPWQCTSRNETTAREGT